MKEHQAAQRENLDLVTVFNEGQNKRGDVGKKNPYTSITDIPIWDPRVSQIFPSGPKIEQDNSRKFGL